MPTNKKVTPPKPETKALTKTQKKLFEKNKVEIETMTREIFGYIAERINRLGTQVIESLLEDFVEELGLDEGWQFDPMKTEFRKDN